MRELYEEIQDYYILCEIGDKPPSSEIIVDNKNNIRKTELTKYKHNSQFDTPAQYHKDYSGVTHDVAWENIRHKHNLDRNLKNDTIRDALHLHNHFIKNNTEIGDIVRNSPTQDDNGDGNKRSRIYAKKAGFGDGDTETQQHGIVKQHLHNHPDMSKRGQKYLHPLMHHEIEEHDDEPSAGASDNKIREISQEHPTGSARHVVKYNSAVSILNYSPNGSHELYQHNIMPKINDEYSSKISKEHALKRFTNQGDKTKILENGITHIHKTI